MSQEKITSNSGIQADHSSSPHYSAFVLLPYNLDIDKWYENYILGEVPDKTPYGYDFAESKNFSVKLARSRKDRIVPLALLRRLAQKLLGFDFLHAWQQRKEIFASDVVWTHTEKEHLAVSLLFKLSQKKRPKLLAQSVWLFESWNEFSSLRKMFFKYLLKQASVLTVHSPENEAIANNLGIPVKCRLVKFGISLESFPPRQRNSNQFHHPIRVLTLGNDRDRDWHTFYNAVSGVPEFEVRVVSRNYPKDLISENISVYQGNLSKVKELYNWADVVVVPLKRNYHASGITVILEAISSGLPVIATDVGGLKAYFNDSEIYYVPIGDAAAMRESLLYLDSDQAATQRLTKLAKQRMLSDDYSSNRYAILNRNLTLELLENMV